VTKLDRLSRSAKDLHETVGRLADKGVALSIDGKIYDPSDPMGKMFIGVLGLMAEFESDLIRSRTREKNARNAGKMDCPHAVPQDGAIPSPAQCVVRCAIGSEDPIWWLSDV